MKSPSYFFYARKSTESEERQQLSIPAQIDELKSFAQKENLVIADILTESKTAKQPGRIVFNEMIKRIESGEASGILAWHPDRLARNAVDAGQIVHLLDTGKLLDLKFPTFWFQNTPQGLFMLSIAFGQSKYYVDSLSENTKRGLRQKVRLGWKPSVAPRGYLNDKATKTIVKDPKTWKLIRRLFEFYATGNHTFEEAADFLAGIGLKTPYGNPLKIDAVKRILSNPFYCGLFWYGGELYQGKHSPIISKKLFDTVQEVLARRSKPQTKQRIPKPFAGFIKCGECGMTITAEIQKGHIYYRCTKKSKTHECSQPYVREEQLLEQVNGVIRQVSLRGDWGEKMLAKLKTEETTLSQSVLVAEQEIKEKIKELNHKLSFLLDSYLDQTISREDYLLKKSQMVAEKKTLEEKVLNLHRRPNDWLEQMREWINTALQADKIASDNKNLFEKRKFLINTRSNLTLKDKIVRCHFLNQWAALTRRPINRSWVRIYQFARNYFIKNG
jgi:DNA invertase Pin-like site-specific DNA recombinase/predicted transcriptional regulator